MVVNCRERHNQPLEPIAARWATPAQLFVLRMKMRLFYIITIFILLFSAISFATENTPYEKAKAEFNELKKQWDKEAPTYSSNTYDYWKGEAAKAIVNMGKRALPFVFDEIQKGNFFFNVAAERITQVRLRDERHQSEQALSKLWINWWHQNKNKPEWNLFLNGSTE
jgi:hypothetical protein